MAKERELKWVKESLGEEKEETEQKKETAEADPEEEAGKEAEKPAGEGSEREAEDLETAAKKEGEEPEEEISFDGKLAEAVERYQRLFAEFDNFRKRTDKEKAARYDMGARDVVEKILPVVDSFELALKNVPEEEKESPFAEGMDKIHKQFLKVLEEIGVTPIEAVGQEFNPEFHNAVMHVEDEEAGENVVIEEFQKGYMYKDHVVRYSMVKVAN